MRGSTVVTFQGGKTLHRELLNSHLMQTCDPQEYKMTLHLPQHEHRNPWQPDQEQFVEHTLESINTKKNTITV